MNDSFSDFDTGIRFIVEPSGVALTAEERVQLRELRPAGIMLRKRNFCRGVSYREWLAAYKDLITDCREAIGRASIIVSVDHEGGSVHRFPSPITQFPYAATYGAMPDAVFEVASAMGAELRSLGINLSYYPVADIHSNPLNPVINERAFGTNASEVCNAVLAAAHGLRTNGIVPCAKHFPGHGDTTSDSHYSVPVVSRSREELEQSELRPFKVLIDDGIEMIMSAHIMVPALDGESQATISRPILTDLLRGTLGFRGVTIADALGMEGISQVVQGGSFPLLAHRAGLDIFLLAGDTVSIQDGLRLREELRESVKQGQIDRSEVLDVEQRLQVFLEALPQYTVQELPAETLERHKRLADLLAENAPWSSFQFHPAGFE